ncbi:hypothetical protein [Spiroplasma culicicola]|uniref:Uncharacterized protein n=1 Tax=Spiroplasma culicicola AES-1 TaxID=1276246 RepID=W6A6P9_9MOLU|nr:hypothetical protein [Spiroplasma culicicola]AHI52672.1 hypothetical protein SCULI_v1c03310 [Spiroplasma culicicola AES-1]
MKVLLVLLSTVSLGVGATAPLVSNINANVYVNPIVISHRKNMEIAINDKTLTFADGFFLYEQVDDMIYKIVDEEYLYSYMNTVYSLHSKLLSLINSEYEQNKLEEQRILIEQTMLNWSNDESISELLSIYKKQSSEEKEVAAKIFYAYNQSSSKLMIEDLEIFQEYKILNIQASTAIASLENQLELHKTSLKVWEDTLKWQEELVRIYDNLINKAKELESQFMDVFNSVLATPEAFFKHMLEKKNEILEPLVDKFLDGSVAKLEELMEDVTNREQNPDKKIEDWVLVGENSDPWDPNEGSPTEISTEQLAQASDNQVELRIKNELTGEETAEEKQQKVFNIVKDVVGEIYRIEDILFSSLHQSSQKFFEFVNNQIPRLSNDVKDAFKKNGIPIETKFDEAIQTALDITNALADQVLSILSPKNEIFGQIKELAFATFDTIEDWYKTISVAKKSSEAIEEIIKIRDEYSTIPEDVEIDVDEVYARIEETEEELERQEQILEETNEILENSKYDILDKNLLEWNEFFGDYTNYLDIIELKENRTNTNLNPIKYFKKELEIYKKNVIERQFTFANLINHENIGSLNPKVIEMLIEENTKLETINQFILKHEGDFN